LAQASADYLLKDLAWPRDSIDLLIFISQTPDYPFPATACVLQEKLGLRKTCAAFDINLGCSGYVYGLWIASQLLSSLGGSRALLLVGDVGTPNLAPEDRSVQFIFGDAAAVTALERRPDAPDMTFVLGTDGTGASHLIIPGGGGRNKLNGTSFSREPGRDGVPRAVDELFMDGPQVFNFTIREVPGLLAQTLDAASWSFASVDKFVFHQANGYLLNYLRKRIEIPADRMVVALKEYGNTSSASIPLAIADKLENDFEQNSVRLLLAGFGVGWSWAGATVVVSKGTPTRVIQIPSVATATTDNEKSAP
jgi:3-oxoacyl-[acyl-carrier-protein] synthase-3